MAAEKLTLKAGAEASLDKGSPFWFGIRYGKVSVVCASMPDEPAALWPSSADRAATRWAPTYTCQ